jgi:hypothetical protein
MHGADTITHHQTLHLFLSYPAVIHPWEFATHLPSPRLFGLSNTAVNTGSFSLQHCNDILKKCTKNRGERD